MSEDSKDKKSDDPDSWMDDLDEEPEEDASESVSATQIVNDVTLKGVPALKGMLAEMTIIPVNATEEERDVGYSNPSMLPLVGAVIGMGLMIFIWIISIVEDVTGAMVWPIFGLATIMASALIFKFAFLADLMNFGGELFPKMSKGPVPLGGIALAIFCIAATVAIYLGLYAFAGTQGMGLVVGITEVCVLNAMVCTRAFVGDKINKTGVAMSTAITMVSVIMITVVWMLLTGNWDVMFIVDAAAAGVISIVGGFLIGFLTNRVLGYVPDTAAGASVELTRATLMGVIMFLVMALRGRSQPGPPRHPNPFHLHSGSPWPMLRASLPRAGGK